ncbi:unnamed protein product [Nesidiocoris tenuis]|uniref:Dual specificity phosphatase 19 n=2 Tax=Nesidiocoris tenuis TaxID=355587 RepID=A0ABN7AA35_9HEMI|nr:Dual specificity phosphatase 19 [Nesidiocoris tenuis]CAB0012247.1 unnamed protein product [Nesidiocoris tenuis]
MSFLSQLVDRKTALVHTKTKVTTIDGKVFTEDRTGDDVLIEKIASRNSGFVVDNQPDLVVADVLPGLLMGAQDVAGDPELLRRHGITHVLNVGHDEIIRTAADDLPIVNHHLPLLDLPETDLITVLPSCFALIDAVREVGGTIYVHCNAGVSRSAAVTIGYLIHDQNLTYTEAYARLKSLRPSIRPNEGFVKQLKLYEKRLAL